MKEPFTKQTWDTLQYRKRQLARKTEQMERLLAGQEQSLLPFLRADGRFSREKAKAFADELLEALELTLRVRERAVLSKAQREFYRDYLYTLLRLADDPPPWVYLFQGTFADLMEMTRDVLQYKDKASFDLDLAYWNLYNSQVFYWLDLAWEIATDEKLVQRITPEDLAEVERRYPEQAKEAKEYNALQSMEIEPWMEEECSEPVEEWMLEEAEQQEAEWQAWMGRFFQDADDRDAYLRWRTAYFDLWAWGWLETQMGEMIDVFLYQRGDSSLLTDDAYFSIYALLNRVEKQLRELLHDQG